MGQRDQRLHNKGVLRNEHTVTFDAVDMDHHTVYCEWQTREMKYIKGLCGLYTESCVEGCTTAKDSDLSVSRKLAKAGPCSHNNATVPQL